MNTYTLVLNKKSGKYYVLENGIKIKNDIFYSKKDFENEMEALNLNGNVIIK